MELLIRSQDKLILEKYNRLIIKEVQNRTYRYGDINKPNEYIIANNDMILGYYTTKERAIEILDKIQQFVEDCEAAGYEIVTYKMPKE